MFLLLAVGSSVYARQYRRNEALAGLHGVGESGVTAPVVRLFDASLYAAVLLILELLVCTGIYLYNTFAAIDVSLTDTVGLCICCVVVAYIVQMLILVEFRKRS